MKIAKRFLTAFTDHPASVGETYVQHARHSVSFGFAMARGAAAAFIHAAVPALCTTTGSRIIARLHDCMILNRSRWKVRTQISPACESHLAEHI